MPDKPTQISAQFRAVTKRFADYPALDNLSFSVRQGEAVALLGPNGAGKTTTLAIFQGLRRPSSGSATVFGASAGSRAAMLRVGVTPQDADFPKQVTPRELIAFTAAHFPGHRSTEHLVEAFGLEQLIDRRISGFSGGERRRIALALALVGRPELVFLDEPSAGLDTGAQADFNRFALSYVAAGGSLILTSHNLPEIEQICQRIVMIDRGKLVLEGSIAEIRAVVRAKKIYFRCAAPSRFVSENFSLENGYWHMLSGDPDKTLRRVFAENPALGGLTVENMPLDEAIEFRRLANGRSEGG